MLQRVYLNMLKVPVQMGRVGVNEHHGVPFSCLEHREHHAHTQTHRHTDTQTHRHTDTDTDTDTDTHTHKPHTHTCLLATLLTLKRPNKKTLNNP